MGFGIDRSGRTRVERGVGSRSENVDSPAVSVVMVKKKPSQAATLDELGGTASKKVKFIRTDARSLITSAPSNSKVKAALTSSLEPQWPPVTKERTAVVLKRIAADCSAARDAGDSHARDGVLIGLGSVTRALRRCELRAIVLAKESQPPLLYAHVPLLAQQQNVTVCALPCSSAQLGQIFGLLRASAVGLAASAFDSGHPLVQLLAEETKQPLFPWLPRALELRSEREPKETNLEAAGAPESVSGSAMEMCDAPDEHGK